tara:strand:- start:89 stop:379 length:291 start_codon:yes stop_codon:yes gene_type:complete
MPKANTADTTLPQYTYQWANAEQTSLKRTDVDGKIVYVPTAPLNSSYRDFLSSGAEAAPYVEPEPLPELSTEEKVNNMLAAYGLTRAELRATLEAN